MKLNLPRRTKKRLIRPMQPLDALLWPNEIWSLDFMSDSLYQGRRFRILNILDEGVREALAIEIDISLPAQRVVRALQQLETWRGLPRAIRLDNGPELTSQHLADWCKDKGIELRFIQPSKPNQNAFIERFNRSYRTEVLNNWLFTSLDEVREITHSGCKAITKNDPMMRWEACPQLCFANNCS
jgi:putative transposase